MSIVFVSDPPQLAAFRTTRKVPLKGEAFRSQHSGVGLSHSDFWLLYSGFPVPHRLRQGCSFSLKKKRGVLALLQIYHQKRQDDGRGQRELWSSLGIKPTHRQSPEWNLPLPLGDLAPASVRNAPASGTDQRHG